MRFFLSLCGILTIGVNVWAENRPETLNVYTYDSFATEWGAGPLIEARFEQICGCDLVFTSTGDGGTILTRLRLEGKKTAADVVLGLDHYLAFTSEKTLFQAHQVEFPKMDFTWDDSIFVPFDYGHFALIYRKDNVPTPPQNLEALAQSDYTLVIQDPLVSTPGLGLAVWVRDVFGDQSRDYWHTLSDNIVTIAPGWSEAYALFLEGGADFVLSYTTSPAYHALSEGDPGYAALVLAEGHPIQIELAAITAHTQNLTQAQAFLRFLMGDEAQAIIARYNWMYPIRAELTPQGFTPPASIPLRSIELGPATLKQARDDFNAGL